LSFYLLIFLWWEKRGGVGGGAIWYNFPISQWAFQVKQQISEQWSLMAGVFEQNPSLLENDTGFKLNLSGGKGVLLPAEVIFKPAKGLFGLPGEYRLGGFLSTADSEDVFKGSDGQPQVLTPGSGFESHSTRQGFWTVLRQQALLLEGNKDRPVELFAFGHINDRDTNYIRSSISMGVTVTGPLAARPNDQLAFALGRLKVNPRFSERQRMLNVMDGETDYTSAGYHPVQDAEYSAELYYAIQATRWLTIRPNLQYIRHPGGVDDVDDAVVVGLKVATKI
jgi:porin